MQVAFALMASRVVLAVGLVAVAATVVALLSQSAPRLAGTNNVSPRAPVAFLFPGDVVCQESTVPRDARSVVLRVPPNPERERRVRVVVRAGGDRTAGDYRDPAPTGELSVALPGRVPAGAGEVCVENRGDGSLALMGSDIDIGAAAQRGISTRGKLSIAYRRGGSESWWSVASVIAERFELGKPGFVGAWTLWAALALTTAGVALAALATARATEEDEQ